MLSQEIRRGFLNFYKSKGHVIVPSSSVIPHDDPTLLFTNAGMNQFKDLFLGKSKRDYSRATTTQKCIRCSGKHNDLENVGHTSRHLTFFEMLGNFSFGDYFKKEAIAFAWELVTKVIKFDEEKVWATVFREDDEAFSIWENYLPKSRIVRFDEKDNFWAMGDTGPCGPCSELLFDRGKAFSDAKSPLEDITGERYLEFWNLVFMQYNRDENGTMNPLPKPSIDTGAGLERLVSLKMGVDNIFLTDILRTLIARVENISKVKYVESDKHLAPVFHVIADHIRSLAFAIADGAIPSNVDRGYVLRKLLRRAARYGRMIGLDRPFLSKILPTLIEVMGSDFPELKKSENKCAEILEKEEESFIKTLNRGGNLLNQIIEKAKEEKRKIEGEESFKLKDTYGFPIEEILLIAKDEHLEVDLKRFEELEEEAKEKSRNAKESISQKFSENFFADFSKSNKAVEFLGHNIYEAQAKVIAIIIDNEFQDSIEEGQDGLIILDKTPFYAEMGGQIGDKGKINTSTALFIVEDTQSPFLGVVTHVGKVKKGKIKINDLISATIDKERRSSVENNHSATHILHWALGKVLGEHVKQAGSLVDDKRLRFDFDHHKALSLQELRDIESLVNSKIRENKPINDYELSYEKAQKDPSIKQIFGEKYLEKVRVVDMEFSKELCGGAHSKSLGTIGYFKIAKESSIAAGIRRIEAMTGKLAEELVYHTEDLMFGLSDLFKTTPQKLDERCRFVLDENKSLNQYIKQIRKEQLENTFSSVINKAKKIGSFNILSEEINLNSSELGGFANSLIDKLKSAIIILATKSDNKCQFVIKISSDIVEKGIYANDLIKAISPIIKGGGGGKKDMAQAGGNDPTKIEEALTKINRIIEEKC